MAHFLLFFFGGRPMPWALIVHLGLRKLIVYFFLFFLVIDLDLGL